MDHHHRWTLFGRDVAALGECKECGEFRWFTGGLADAEAPLELAGNRLPWDDGGQEEFVQLEQEVLP